MYPDNDGEDGNSVIIDSMSAGVQNCVDEPLVVPQINTFHEQTLNTTPMQKEYQTLKSRMVDTDEPSMGGEETELLDTSKGSIAPPKYNPTGTHVVLPQKRGKPILTNPEKTITEIWKKDAISCKWTITLPKLDS